MTAQPPRRSIDETMMFVQMPKKRKVRCAGVPQRTSIISRKVCAFGHLRLTSMARMPKTRTWIEAPEAYQKGPVMPYCHATLDDWRRVAAHVHWETMTEAVRPVLMSRPAVLKCSEVRLPPPKRTSIIERATVRIEKAMPKPISMASARTHEGRGVLCEVIRRPAVFICFFFPLGAIMGRGGARRPSVRSVALARGQRRRRRLACAAAAVAREGERRRASRVRRRVRGAYSQWRAA